MPRSFLVKQHEPKAVDMERKGDGDHSITPATSSEDVPFPSLPPPLLKVSPRSSSKSSVVSKNDRPVPQLITRPPAELEFQTIEDEKCNFYSEVTSPMLERSWIYPDMHQFEDYARHLGHKNRGFGLKECIDTRHDPRFFLRHQAIDKKTFLDPYINAYHVMHHEPIMDRYPRALYGNIGYYGTKENIYNHLTLTPKYYMPAMPDTTVVSNYNNKNTRKDREIEKDMEIEQQGEQIVESASPDSTQSSLETAEKEGQKTASKLSKGGDERKVQQSTARKYRYTCDVCGKSFSRSNTLTTHKRIHTGDKPFHCEQCGRAFRQPGNLTRHRLTHTAIKPYVCPQCNKAFNRASNLHTHMRTHTNYKPFVCDFCGKGFHQKIDMKIHRYTHTGEKPHKCTKCGRGFKQLTHLTYHMRTHSDERLYKCEYCGKGFNQKGNLQAHIYGHTGERPFKCDVCGKGFTLASTLNTHKRTHATKKPFDCQFCGKAFYQKNALKTHYIASHPFANGVSLL